VLYALPVLVAVGSGVVAQQTSSHQIVPLEKMASDPGFEVLFGDPTKVGVPYVVRIKTDAGYIVMPHTHPEDENIVVVKGSWSLGMGDKVNRQALTAMELGTYGHVPRKMAHFGFSKTEVVIQVHGIGPFSTDWVEPMFNLTDKGVFVQKSAGEQGALVQTPPAACFALSLGMPVSGTLGDGRIVGALCAPMARLTQYWVQKPDGERFWATRDELTTR
jgi:hypothetical protein